MTGALQLLEELSKVGVRVEADTGRIRFAPKSAITDEMVGRLRQHKAEIISILIAGECVDRSTTDGDDPHGKAPKIDDAETVHDVYVDGNTLKPEENGNTVDVDVAKAGETDVGWHRYAWFRPLLSSIWDDFSYLTAADFEYLTAPRTGANRCVWCGRASGHVSPTAGHPGCVALFDEWAIRFSGGRHKGQPVRDLNTDYLRWAAGKMANLPIRVRDEIDRVLQERKERDA